MKLPIKNRRTKSTPKNSPKGFVQVAVWKESLEILKHQDVFTNYSQEVFYDFVRPLKVLDAPGWSSMIKVSPSEDEGFFVFRTEEKYF